MSQILENQGRYDDLFFAVLQQEGKMEPFFTHIFDFLFRRTDFFIAMKTPTDKMGFPPGISENIVREAYKKYETLAKARELKAQQPKKKQVKRVDCSEQNKIKLSEEYIKNSVKDKLNEKLPDTLESYNISPVISINDNNSNNNNNNDNNNNDDNDDNNNNNNDNDDNNNNNDSNNNNNNNINNKEPASDIKPNLYAASESNIDSSQQTPINKVQPGDCGDIYNGAANETYKWSQSITDLDILLQLPNPTKPNNVQVHITTKHITVKLMQDDGDETIVLDGEFPYKVFTASSMWTMEGQVVHISIDKVQERMWPYVVEGEKEIDLTKVEVKRDVSELDTESQAAVNRVRFDHHQKELGLPQSNEIQSYEMLKEAWDKEGSPFKGTPYDPSLVNIANSGYNM